MSSIREQIDAWKPIFDIGVSNLFEGMTQLPEESLSRPFSPGSYERRMRKAVRQKHAGAGKKAFRSYIAALLYTIASTEYGDYVSKLSRQNRRRLEQARRRYSRGRPRRPTPDQGKWIAEYLLADPNSESQYDPDEGLKPISILIATAWLSAEGGRDEGILRDIVEASYSSAFFWDVVDSVDKGWDAVRKAPPDFLVQWREEFRTGLRVPPPKKPGPVGRHLWLQDLIRNLKVWFTVKVLKDIGITPTGSNGGLKIAADVVHLKCRTVEKIWYRDPWEMVREYAEYIVTDNLPQS